MAKNRSLTDVTGVGAVTADALRKAGVKTPVSLAKAKVGRIAAVPGFGALKAAAVIKAAAALSKPSPAVEVKKRRKDKNAGNKNKKRKKDKKINKKKNKKNKKKNKKGKKKK